MEEDEGQADLEVENFRESVAYIFQDWVGQGMDLDYDQAVQGGPASGKQGPGRLWGGLGPAGAADLGPGCGGRAGEPGAGGQGKGAPGQVSRRQVLEGVG